MKYLVSPSKLGPIGAALLQQLAQYQGMDHPPTEVLAQAPLHPAPSPSKLFSQRGKRRLGLVAAEKRAKRRAQKAARRKNRRAR